MKRNWILLILRVVVFGFGLGLVDYALHVPTEARWGLFIMLGAYLADRTADE